MMTIVLVHGAFADASSWSEVIRRLQKQGHTVVAPANPLRGLTADTAYIASVVNQIEGPVLLVGHSYAGALISSAATKAPNVSGLVFVAAYAPKEGERLGDYSSKDAILGPALQQRQYPTGRDGETAVEFIVDMTKFHEAFAADLSAEWSAVLAATQRPAAGGCFSDLSGPVASKEMRSWAVVATRDKAAGTDVVRAQAKRAGATIVEVEASHLAMLSQPQVVTDVILEAARAVGEPAEVGKRQ